MTILHPGAKIEEFISDFVMYTNPRGTVEHGSPKPPDDGRCHVNDHRPSATQPYHNDKGLWVSCRGRPTDLCLEVIREMYGSWGPNSMSAEIIPWGSSKDWPEGAILLQISASTGFRVTYDMCLEVPNYSGFKFNDEVQARWWDGKPYPAVVVGLGLTTNHLWAYRCRFPHVKPHDSGRMTDVLLCDVRKKEDEQKPATCDVQRPS